MALSYLFATNSNPELAKSVAVKAGIPLGPVLIGRYSDGEIMVKLETDVKNKNVAVLGSSYPPGDHLLELYSLINTLKMNGTAKITVVIPYFGYGKSDHADRPGFGSNARLFAEFLAPAGADTAVTLDLHSDLATRHFTIPNKQLSAMALLAHYFVKEKIINPAIATPDFGGLARAKEFASILGQNEVILVEKHRPTADTAEVVHVEGDIADKNIILVDDMIQTGNTLLAAAGALKERGAGDIYVAATHLLYCAPGVKNLSNSALFKKIVVTNSIPKPPHLILASVFHIEKIDALIASAL